MTFFIQASTPELALPGDALEEYVDQAVESVFRSETEDAILNWHGVSVALNYKYDLSVMIEDLSATLEAIVSQASGRVRVGWPSNTFCATWTLCWDETQLTCEAEWESVSGGVEALLAKAGPVALTTGEFLAEWKLPLARVVAALRYSGYDAESLSELPRIERLVSRIQGSGRLYGAPSGC